MDRRNRKSTAYAVLAGVGLLGVSAIGAVSGVVSVYRRRSRRSLEGKVVLITGSSRGLGLALAEEFGRLGSKLILNARDENELSRAKAILLDRNATLETEDILTVAADLRVKEEADRLVREAKSRFGRIDVLVNNAGIISVGPIENQTVENFRDLMDTNFFSGVHCSLAVIPEMIARHSGAIVNIASIGGKIAVPHLLPYTASKFAAMGFSQGLNAELRSKGIKVTTVCPGLMRTGSHLNATFTGDAPREYRWFSLGASLPGVSISASAAARKIVMAVATKKSEISITPQAMVAARLGNVFPELTTGIMIGVNAVLPASVMLTPGLKRGGEVRELEITPAIALGASAARRYNQQ